MRKVYGPNLTSVDSEFVVLSDMPKHPPADEYPPKDWPPKPEKWWENE
jgi:hypothetical protein